MQELHFLYLIASGNNDSIYKVGISVDPNARLRQIKATYNVPKAYIVETMDVSSRSEVFAMEAALHARLEDRRVTRYGGREFFKLSQADLEWLRSLYNDNSNDFAQAKAYYGLELAAAELRSKAQAIETDRQRKISHNRRHGKTYDTKPSGDLKRYKSLKEKLEKGHLGERFQIVNHEHPALALSRKIQQKASDIIAKKNSLNFLKVCAIGLFSGAIVAAAQGGESTMAFALTGGSIGLLSGSFSQGMRGRSERNRVKRLVESELEYRYPLMKGKTMLALTDLRRGNSFLIRDYCESTPNLRNQTVAQPNVSLPSQEQIYSILQGKSYFPKVATAITIGLLVGITIGNKDKNLNKLTLDQGAQAIGKAGRNQSLLAESQSDAVHEVEQEASQRKPLGVPDPELIHKEYKISNAATISKYSGKYYSVNGIVDNREDDYIKLDSRTLLGGAVYCYYQNNAERQKVSLLQRNQGLTVSGLLRLTPKSTKRLRVDAIDCIINP
jgi:hypothetical protein